MMLVYLPPHSEAAAKRGGPNEAYLSREFAWAMFLDTDELKEHLNYKGSQLHPLIRVRASFRSYLKERHEFEDSPPARYEELWYHKGTPVGLRRYSRLEAPRGQFGAIVVRPCQIEKAGSDLAITNAVVRLLLDLQFKKLATNLVLVPEGAYDLIASDLGSYRFYPLSGQLPREPLSLHLRSYPYRYNKDEYFFFHP